MPTPAKLLTAKFLKSAVFEADYPDQKRPEIAIAGRSNAGKSSFINVMTRSKIAKISQEPGKTRLLNFFDVGSHYRIVDMPGYGFAARSGGEVENWELMIETYLSTRENLSGLLILMDIRRDWADEEEMIVEFMNKIGKPVMLILTKQDRCTRNEIAERKRILQRAAGLQSIWSISSQENVGVKEVEEHFFKNWIKVSNNKSRNKSEEI